MLKLERSHNNRRISIRMREKERFLNKVFLCALAAAIVLHFLPLTLFTITPFRLGYTPRTIPPATVSAEMGASDALVKTSAEDSGLSVKHLGLLATSTTPQIPLTSTSQLLPITYPDLAIEVSGPLAEQKLILNDTLKAAMTPYPIEGTSFERDKVIYNVRYEGEHGTLFWYEPLQLSPNKKINALAENILTMIRFQQHKSDVIISGTIELTLTLY